MRRPWILGTLLLGCTRPVDPPAVRVPDPPERLAAPPPSAIAATTSASASPPSSAPSPEPAPIAAASYPWLAATHDARPLDRLAQRIRTPPGFTRVPLAEGSFGAWLRDLPLEPRGTPVRSYRGATILPPDHPHLEAVVALDVGAQDLQQCADAVIRLHAEWSWSRGRRDESYRAASGAEMPFARWALGERTTASGPGDRKLTWAPAARPDDSYPAFRAYLDNVFAWANTGSLARDTTPVALADLRPGDFVVQPGGPGHAVLLLDVVTGDDATGSRGQRFALLGQGFMPAQSFQVLRRIRPNYHVTPIDYPLADWFPLDGEGLTTPFWPRFPWSSLRRFPGT